MTTTAAKWWSLIGVPCYVSAALEKNVILILKRSLNYFIWIFMCTCVKDSLKIGSVGRTLLGYVNDARYIESVFFFTKWVLKKTFNYMLQGNMLRWSRGLLSDRGW